jgi:hypothetical protein
VSISDFGDRVELRNGAYVVDGSYAVIRAGGKWDAYPYPECMSPYADDEPIGGYQAGAETAEEKIRELIGEAT